MPALCIIPETTVFIYFIGSYLLAHENCNIKHICQTIVLLFKINYTERAPCTVLRYKTNSQTTKSGTCQTVVQL